MVAITKYTPTRRQLARAREEGWADWIQTPQDEAAVARGCYFDIKSALTTRFLFERVLTHGKAPFAGEPFKLLDWQWHGLIGPLYGWKMPDATRRFLSSFTFIPKKNGKTQLAAGIAIREAMEQIGARVYMTAVARSQAADCFDEAAGMIERAPSLEKVFDVRRSTYRAIIPTRNACIAAITASGGSSQGKNANCLILDELHEWKDRSFFGSLLYATTARINSLVFMITTAGDSRTSICFEEYERACRIRDGKDMSIDHLPVIFEAGPDDDWKKLATWERANPSYGITLPVRNIEAAINQAKGSPERIGDLKRYRLNQWTQPRDAWLDVPTWDALPEADPSELDGMRCYAGVDLARVHDFAAFVRLFEHDDASVSLLFKLWIPADLVVEKSHTDQIPLADWVSRGFVTATPGASIDFSLIRREIVEAHKQTPLKELGYDPALAELLCNQMLRGEDGLNTVQVPPRMGYMSPPSTEFERLIDAGKVRHDHNPAVSWMVGNVIVYRDSNDQIRPMKGRSKGRIDGITAAIIAINRRMQVTIEDKPTHYDTHKVEFI
ncbi:terminase large subunit [Neorhodopirellula pilleata]|uniref:Phage Terminase n=1 Tax=Neorhodopirellula pilleata TaxID=2714738 RepID=A0A5C5ZW76_9BACT|nr:terminase TerL endonuclease subunit [Neorhodopirellula pilleata]TWT91406.1 Phage Terminase [Neorhodopirellula pilleata]TWT91455.1 Phage Terminase [Neorhodopirellula pilleata]